MPYEDMRPRLDKLMSDVLRDKKLTPDSKKLIKEHVNFLQAQGRDIKTSIKHLFTLKIFINSADGKLDFKTLSRIPMQSQCVLKS